MPGLLQKFGAGSVSSNGIWSKHHGNITFDQLRKFWSELSHHDRQMLLRIDKQTLFEQARKNLYCSRCNGLLLEGFSQIVMYGKSFHQEGGGVHLPSKSAALKNHIDNGLGIISFNCHDDVRDPSVHPWGGLAATRDGILTLLDCFLHGASLETLQNIFDSARARERERELLYPDACGGGGRGWISQGISSYGRGHGNRETCALHTARLSCDTLVDFWSALSDETRQSLLRMKEEDFIERLMYRFDSKRFCRDCRRNVIREFKELKELKRMRREPRCTNWFCVADAAFQYEVSEESIQADWRQSFTDAVGMYHHFEWAVGTGEGKSDVLEFEDVGTNASVQVNGLDLGGLSGCFITLRAWKLDGRYSEFTVKAHALKGQPCVHRRLIVGDGFVTITKGESIKSFFERAEEAEEEEDDDSMDKDGNELDGDGPRSQKHAKSPELAREFLLDAATVIFKEQVEKAFREGTARQNAHSIFVCLALKLLEERVHVACKEIITLEKQIKLLEEEEKEKREEEERKERRRAKEREKKLRRKERLKEKEREKNCTVLKELPIASQMPTKELLWNAQEEPHCTSTLGGSISETGDIMPGRPRSSDILDEISSNGYINLQNLANDSLSRPCDEIGELNTKDNNGSFMIEQSKSSRRKMRFRKESLGEPAPRWCDRRGSLSGNEGCFQVDKCDTKLHGYMVASSRCFNGLHRQSRYSPMKHNARNCGPKFGEKFHCSNNQVRDRYDHSCSCNSHADYSSKVGRPISIIRSGRDFRTTNKSVSALDITRSFNHGSKNNQGSYISDICGVPKGKFINGKIPPARDVMHIKKVWEPMESRKRCPRSISDPDVISMSSASNACDGNGNGSLLTNNILNSFDEPCSSELSGNLGNGGDEEVGLQHFNSNFTVNNALDPSMSTSSSDNCSSCLSEGDSSAQITESLSTSDSEDTSQQSECKENSTCCGSADQNFPNVAADVKCKTNDQAPITSEMTSGFLEDSCIGGNHSTKIAHNSYNDRIAADTGSEQHHLLPLHNQSTYLPVFPAPSTLDYYHQTAASSWASAPTRGLVPFPQPNHYVYPSSHGYGLSTNRSSPFCMQYGALQPLATSVLTVSQLPFYQTGSKANTVNSRNQTLNSKLGGAHEAISENTVIREHSLQMPFPNQELPQKAPPPGQDGSAGDPGRSHGGSTFSLFHFGGPVAAAAAEHNPNPILSKNDVIGNFSSKLPAADSPDQLDLSGTTRDTTIEEYSLFSANNGVKFSFF